ncbi:MAG TPA: hypothetical protein VM900_05070 [Sphingomonas sp.]|jgi:pseudouridine-5'-phosphate glycosidase|nr:hypothetical protein [Sphingomonas sp.]
MADYRNDGDHTTARRGGAGRTIMIVLAIAAIIAAILFATGFWSADVKEGALPDVDVSAKGGALPDVDVDSKKVVVGTKETTVDVPKVKTEKETIDVPVVGVAEGEGDKK